MLKATDRAMDAHAAFDGAAEKVEKQLRRYMRQLKDRGAPSRPTLRRAADDGALIDEATDAAGPDERP